MLPSFQADPCRGFPVAVLFQDVDPDVLAREAASESGGPGRVGAGAWDAYLRRVLPDSERNAAEEMALSLLGSGKGAHDSRTHAEHLRRQALAAGLVKNARFWADVAHHVTRVTRF